MKKRWTLLFSSIFTLGAFGQTDTLWSAEVIASAQKFPEQRTLSDSLILSLLQAADYLQKDSRFLLKQYAPGSVVTSSFGGASSEQSRILWDGIDISSMASGVLDLSLVPGTLVSVNSVVDGIYGGGIANSGSMGALNLQSQILSGRGASTMGRISSIGEKTFIADSWGSFSGTTYQSSIKARSSANSFPYQLGAFQGVRTGNDYSDLSYLQSFKGSMGKMNWKSDLWYTQSSKANSGSILSPGYINNLEDKMLRYKYLVQRRAHQFQAYLGREWQTYSDTMGPFRIVDTNTYSQASLLYTRSSSRLEWQLSGNLYSADGSNRSAQSFVPNTNLLLRLTKQSALTIKGTMFNGTPHFGGYLGRKWTGEKQNLFLAMGSYYRLPTLNELYWNPGGNPDLKSERSFGFKMGTKSLTRTAFHLSTDQLYYSQLIQWAPSNSGLWTPQNYAAVYTSTTTGRVHGKYGNNFNELSVTHQFSRVLEVKSQDPAVIGKSLLYRPAFQVVNTFERTLPTGALQCRLYFTSKRHTLRDNALSGVLPSQSWMDVSYVVKSKKDTWAMIFQIENITNAERQFYQYYPMPGRVYSMNIKINSK